MTSSIKPWEARLNAVDPALRKATKEEAKDAEIAEMRSTLAKYEAQMLRMATCAGEFARDACKAQSPSAPVAPPVTPKHIEEIKDLLLWPVTEDDARVARDMLQSVHFDLSMAQDSAPVATELLTESYSAMLWLLRRLPNGYGTPPHIAVVIKAVAATIGSESAEFLAERAALSVKAGDDDAAQWKEGYSAGFDAGKWSAAPTPPTTGEA